MTPAQRYNQRQINYWMNMLADHGDSFDETGRDILAKIKFHNACLKAHSQAM